MPRTIAIYGKGGIGKSFITTNMTATFASMGKRVLQLGCDPKHDSTTTLFGGLSLPTVTEVFGEKTAKNEKVQVEDIVFKKTFPDISGEIFGIELGGPEVGRGCGGRGIISGFDVLEKLGLFKWDLDVVLMDFLGDVVCGGFATPLARSLCEEVILVVSNDRQSIFAANNICVANNYFKTVGGSSRLLGLIVNRDDGSGIAERYAEAAGINVLMTLPYDSEARDKADSFDLAIRLPNIKAKFDALCSKIWNREIPYCEARGLNYDEFMRLFGEVDSRKPEPARLSDLRLEKNLDLDGNAILKEKLEKEAFIANGFQKPIQIALPSETNALGDKVAIGSNADSLPEHDEFIKKERKPLMAAKRYGEIRKAEKNAPNRVKTDHERLLDCIAKLPRIERELITLSEIKKKSPDEIAIEKQLDRAEVLERLASARARLKELFFQPE
ncbi:MAG: chlorophyllide a reductase iron protein subunit X [Chloroherpetonaceae bacterium]|nr:chlorophyllide a reductase iron protein subunit X [Chloroherpetonaceae bacterium]